MSRATGLGVSAATAATTAAVVAVIIGIGRRVSTAACTAAGASAAVVGHIAIFGIGPNAIGRLETGGLT